MGSAFNQSRVTRPRPPGGRLTLTSGTPVMASDVTNATSVYYTPYQGAVVTLYDGSAWYDYTFAELTNTLSDNTKNPAAAAADNNYDLFVWNDSGTLRLGRGPAWSSSTSRGTGAGTTELERVEGVWVNKVAITNGPTAQRGTYVGTVRTDSSGGQIDWSPASRMVWNAYNRVLLVGSVINVASHTYTTAAWRAWNADAAGSQIQFVLGFAEDVWGGYRFNNQGSGAVSASVGINTTGGPSGTKGEQMNNFEDASSSDKFLGGDGYNYLVAVEYGGGGTGSSTYERASLALQYLG
jgi:hypothetical protein